MVEIVHTLVGSFSHQRHCIAASPSPSWIAYDRQHQQKLCRLAPFGHHNAESVECRGEVEGGIWNQTEHEEPCLNPGEIRITADRQKDDEPLFGRLAVHVVIRTAVEFVGMRLAPEIRGGA